MTFSENQIPQTLTLVHIIFLWLAQSTYVYLQYTIHKCIYLEQIYVMDGA